MHGNTHIHMVAKDFSRSRKREPSISGTFDRLNLLDYKRAEQSYHEGIELRKGACSKVGRI